MHRRRESLVAEVLGDGASLGHIRPHEDMHAWRARDLPETALRVASRRPTANLSTATLTCPVVWAREVLRGLVNPRASMACKGSGVQIPSAPPGTTHRQATRSGPSVSRLSADPAMWRCNTLRVDRIGHFGGLRIW